MDLSNLSSNLPLTIPPTKESVDDTNRQLNNEFKNAAKSVTNLYNNLNSQDQDSHTMTSGGDGSSIANHPPNGKHDRIQSRYHEDFTNAAKSVASLYRLSKNLISLNHYFGYLSCLNDLLLVIETNGDLENWILTKKHELDNLNSRDKYQEFKSRESHENELPERDDSEDKHDEIDDDRCSNTGEVRDIRDMLNHEFAMNKDLILPYKFKLGYPPLSVNHRRKLIKQESFKEKLNSKDTTIIDKDITSDDSENDTSDDVNDKKRKAHFGSHTRKKRRDSRISI